MKKIQEMKVSEKIGALKDKNFVLFYYARGNFEKSLYLAKMTYHSRFRRFFPEIISEISQEEREGLGLPLFGMERYEVVKTRKVNEFINEKLIRQ